MAARERRVGGGGELAFQPGASKSKLLQLRHLTVFNLSALV